MAKKQISIYLDERVINEFRHRAEVTSTGYQTLINDALLSIIENENPKHPLELLIRRIIREELARTNVHISQGE